MIMKEIDIHKKENDFSRLDCSYKISGKKTMSKPFFINSATVLRCFAIINQ